MYITLKKKLKMQDEEKKTILQQSKSSGRNRYGRSKN